MFHGLEREVEDIGYGLDRLEREVRQARTLATSAQDMAVRVTVRSAEISQAHTRIGNIPFGAPTGFFYSGRGHRIGTDEEQRNTGRASSGTSGTPPPPLEPYPYAVTSGASAFLTADPMVLNIEEEPNAVRKENAGF